jgi:sortase A
VDAEVVEVGLRKVEGKGKSVFVWETADYAAGFHLGSAYPGNVGNTVLSGHHNIKGEVFRYLVLLEPGDEVYLYVGEVEYTYVVVEKFIIPEKYASLEQRRENAKWIGYFPDERLTLVTCWPYISNTHRVIVIAKPPPNSS